MQANKYIYHSFIHHNRDNINVYPLKLIRKGSLLLEKRRKNTYSIAYAVLIGIKEDRSHLKIILISI